MNRRRLGLASVVRGGSLVGTSQIVSAGLASLISILLARQLGADGFGTYAIAMTFVIFIGAIASMGQGHIVIANLAHSGDHPERPDPIWTSVGIGALSSLVLAVGTFTVFEFGPWGPPPEIGLSGSVFTAILIVTSTANSLISESFRGLSRLGHASFMGVFTQRLLFVAMLLAAAQGVIDMTPSVALGLNALASSVALLAAVVDVTILRRNARQAIPSASEGWATAISGLPIVSTNVMGIVFQRLPIWVLGATGSLAGAGVYALASSLIGVLMIVKKTVNGTLAPYIASASVSGSRERLQRNLRTAAAAATVVTVVFAALLLAVGWIVVPLIFDADFGLVIPTAAVLALASVVATATGSCGYLLNLTGNQRWAMYASLSSIAIALPGIWIGAALCGAPCAAAGSTLAVALNNLLLMYFAYRETGINTSADLRQLAPVAQQIAKELRRSPSTK